MTKEEETKKAEEAKAKKAEADRKAQEEADAKAKKAAADDKASTSTATTGSPQTAATPEKQDSQPTGSPNTVATPDGDAPAGEGGNMSHEEEQKLQAMLDEQDAAEQQGSNLHSNNAYMRNDEQTEDIHAGAGSPQPATANKQPANTKDRIVDMLNAMPGSTHHSYVLYGYGPYRLSLGDLRELVGLQRERNK